MSDIESRSGLTTASPAYLPLPTHEAALARISHAVGGAAGLTELRAPAGAGKSTVVREARQRLREGASLRVVQVEEPADWGDVLARSSEQVGREFGEFLRLARRTGKRVLVIIDGDQHFSSGDRAPCRWIGRQAGGPPPGPMILLVGRPLVGEGDPEAWIRLRPLTFAELAVLVGREATIEPRAAAILHQAAGGWPGPALHILRAAGRLAVGAGRSAIGRDEVCAVLDARDRAPFEAGVIA